MTTAPNVGGAEAPSDKRVVVILAHPNLHDSRINVRLAEAASSLTHVTVHDIAAAYPEGGIDVAREQQLVSDHDIVVWQFPWHWYSVPGVLKVWIDQVLTPGWAYGGGTALAGKTLQVVTSTGGPEQAYTPGGYNRFTMDQLLLPLAATAHLCGMEMAEPFIVHGARTLSDEDVALESKRYQVLLEQA